MKLKFKWTDELVKEFSAEVSKGQCGIFRGCPKFADKIAEFKRIHSTDKELMKAHIRAMSERKFNMVVDVLNTRIKHLELMKSTFPKNAFYYDFEIDQYNFKLDMIKDYRK